MSHDPFDERLSAYLDGQLAPQERQEVEAQLRQRPDLVQALDQVRQLGDGVRQLPSHRLGEDFADRVLAAAGQTGAKTASPAASVFRRGWLLAAAGAMAAVAAAVLAMIALNSQPVDIVQQKPPVLSPAEQAVASVLASAQEGKAVIVRLRLTKDAIRGKALDQALAAQGIAAAPATATNLAAQETAQAYKTLAQPGQSPLSAADVLFIEADPVRLQKALAAVAQSADGTSGISSGGVVPSTKAGIDRLPKVEGETGTSNAEIKVEGRNYAQHLPPRGFPLLKPAAETPKVQKSTLPAAAGGKPARVLVVVEVIP